MACGIYLGLCGLVPLCLAFVAFTWVYAAFAALAFCILCITSSSGGFLALWLLAAFWLWLLASSAFPLGFLDRDLIAPLFESSLLRTGGLPPPPNPRATF